jgi:hypothetical protein
VDINHGGSKAHYGCYITTDSTAVIKKGVKHRVFDEDSAAKRHEIIRM